MTFLPIAADAGEAGRKDLRDKRYALSRMLLSSEQQDRKYHQAAPWADAKKPRSQAADGTDHDAVEKPSDVQLAKAPNARARAAPAGEALPKGGAG